MAKYILSILFIINSLSVNAIDIHKTTVSFSPEQLKGKSIIIPTYNGGVNKLNFVYNTSVLNSQDFTYKNLSSVNVLGIPIFIADFKILNEGKAKEALCLVANVGSKSVILYFPMHVKKDDYNAIVTSELFYGMPTKVSNNYEQYSIKGINIPYYLSDDIISFEDRHKGKVLYPMVGNQFDSHAPYLFLGLKFTKEYDLRNNLDDNTLRYHVKSELTRSTLKNGSYRLDVLCALLQKGKKTYYMQINSKGSNYGDRDGLEVDELNSSLLEEEDYKRIWAEKSDKKLLFLLDSMFTSKEIYLEDNNCLKGQYALTSKDQKFSQYEVQPLSNLSQNYYLIDGIEQIKTSDRYGRVDFDYYIKAKGIQLFDSSQIYIAFLPKKEFVTAMLDGMEHRKQVKIEEEKRERENAERRAQLALEEREYKKSLIRRYGTTNANIILNGEVKIGFNKDMCIEAWGNPDSINTTTTMYGSYEQWVYGLGLYLYFRDNKLVGIQN